MYVGSGYYDCFDAVHLTVPAKDLYGRETNEKVWQKMDHSQFVWHGPRAGIDGNGGNPGFHGKGGACWRMDNADGDGVTDVKALLDYCTATKYPCEAVQCVPLHPPAHVVDRQLNAPYVWFGGDHSICPCGQMGSSSTTTTHP